MPGEKRPPKGGTFTPGQDPQKIPTVSFRLLPGRARDCRGVKQTRRGENSHGAERRSDSGTS
jgi:hypothetical protein